MVKNAQRGLSSAVVAALFLIGSAPWSAAAGGAAGGGSAAAGGHSGGGAAGSAGGGGAAGGHAGGGTATGGGTTAAGGTAAAAESRGGTAASGGARATAGTGGQTGTVTGGTAGGTAVTTTAGGSNVVGRNAPGIGQAGRADVGGRYHNPYAPRNGQNDNVGYGVAYGYPWYPFSYGWNPGWYGSGYGNGYNTVPYSTTGFSDNGNANNGNANNGNATAGTASSTNAGTAGAVTGTMPVTQVQTAAGVHAQMENAAGRSPELTTANSAVANAQASYNQNRERVLADLAKKPEYQDAVKRRRDAAGKVAAAKAGETPGQPTPVNTPASPAVVAAAEAKLDAGDEVTKMEEQAVAADPAAAVAKARLEQAQNDRDALHNQLMGQVQPR